MPVTSAAFFRTTLLFLLVGFLAVFAIIAASLWLAAHTNANVSSLTTILEIRREVFTVLNHVQNAQGGQRGYLLTLEEAYLEPYRSALEDIEREVEALQVSVSEMPDFQDEVQQLSGVIDAKLQELTQTIDLARAGDVEAALAIVRSDRGERAMDAVRVIAGGLIDQTSVMIAAGGSDLRSSARWLIWALAAGGTVILLVVGGSAYLTWRYTQDLERARTEVMALNTTLERRVLDRGADLARANDEIQRFAYIVSHDLRSPLVNVMGFTSELEEALKLLEAALEETQAKYDSPALKEARAAITGDIPEALRFIRSSTSKMDSLINAILRLSREGRRSLSSERLNMRKIFENAISSVRHQLDAKEAEATIEGSIPDIDSDRLAVEQVFGNLIDNAVKYLEDGRAGRIVVRAEENPLGIEFEIEDNGRGIAEDDRERIFELFRRAGAQDQPGEGIGLPHVRALVRRLGGTISLRSEIGKGSAFRVRLPRVLPLLRESA